MLEQRVTRIEEQMGRIQTILERLEPKITEAASVKSDIAELRSKDIAEMRSRLAFVEGRLQGMPTTWQMFTTVLASMIATWGAGAAIVLAILRFARP